MCSSTHCLKCTQLDLISTELVKQQEVVTYMSPVEVLVIMIIDKFFSLIVQLLRLDIKRFKGQIYGIRNLLCSKAQMHCAMVPYAETL